MRKPEMVNFPLFKIPVSPRFDDVKKYYAVCTYDVDCRRSKRALRSIHVYASVKSHTSSFSRFKKFLSRHLVNQNELKIATLDKKQSPSTE